ncbi:MAG: patatin-like phospholipase family protein [Rudaea sp.]
MTTKTRARKRVQKPAAAKRRPAPAPAAARTKAAAPRASRTQPPAVIDSLRRYETVALVLQGGGALGAYQCGVYEGLHRAGVRPNWFAGISIGALNAAILAGNAPEDRIERLHAFWNRISVPAVPFAQKYLAWQQKLLDSLPTHNSALSMTNSQGALGALFYGQQGFYKPRFPPPWPQIGDGPAETSFYDTTDLKHTLEELVDFDRINHSGVRLSVGAVNVRTGNFINFDNGSTTIRVEHVMASGALPPAFAAVEIDGEHYWDGGVVSNTPLDHVLGATPRKDSLVLQVDLWRAQGILPRNLMEVFERQKDIQYSSRTRFNTKVIKDWQDMRTTLTALLKEIPRDHVSAEMLAQLEPWLSDRVFNIIHLIYQTKPFEEQYKDYAFAPSTTREHWQAGLTDMRRTLAHPEFFAPPPRRLGAVTHDVHR